jgi:hypothetical protein
MTMIQGLRKGIGRCGQFSSAFQHYRTEIAFALREATKAQALRLMLVMLGRT